MKELMEFPIVNYPCNQLVREKTDFTIKLWQKLCICYTVLEIVNDPEVQKTGFPTIGGCLKHCDEVLRKYAQLIVAFYVDSVPVGVTVDEICARPGSNTSQLEDEVDFYEYEFNQIKSQLASSYFTLWKKVKSDLNESTSLDVLLFEFRRRLHNRVRRQKLSKDLNQSWFPIEWLCFVTFGVSLETKKILDSTNGSLKRFISSHNHQQQTVDSAATLTSITVAPQIVPSLSNPPKINLYCIHDYPPVSYPLNTMPRSFTKKSIKFWQRLCVSYTMMEYYRFKQAAGLTSSYTDKADYLQKSYRYYAKQLVHNYSKDIPHGLTADILCQGQVEVNGNGNENDDAIILANEKSRRITYLNGHKIYRIWTDITPKINQLAMKAWSDTIMKKYTEEEIQEEELRPEILLVFRKKWWELQYTSDQVAFTKCGSLTRLYKKPKNYESTWFPLEWLTFLCFGPLSPSPYFSVNAISTSEMPVVDEFLMHHGTKIHVHNATPNPFNRPILRFRYRSDPKPKRKLSDTVGNKDSNAHEDEAMIESDRDIEDSYDEEEDDDNDDYPDDGDARDLIFENNRSAAGQPLIEPSSPVSHASLISCDEEEPQSSRPDNKKRKLDPPTQSQSQENPLLVNCSSNQYTRMYASSVLQPKHDIHLLSRSDENSSKIFSQRTSQQQQVSLFNEIQMEQKQRWLSIKESEIQLKQKDMNLQKIFKLIDVCSVATFQNTLAMNQIIGKEGNSAMNSTPTSSTSTNSTHPPIVPNTTTLFESLLSNTLPSDQTKPENSTSSRPTTAVTTSNSSFLPNQCSNSSIPDIYQHKLLKWIEELESFNI